MAPAAAGSDDLTSLAFARGQQHALELIADGAPLEEALDFIVRTIEEHASGMRGSVVLLPDGVHVRHGAAPHLPSEYVALIDGMAIGPAAGSCGTAMWEGKRVIVTDIATDPLWVHYREIALRFGLRACWSTPLRSGSGSVIGSFAMYYDEPRAPTVRDLSLADVAGHLSALAVQHAMAGQELRKRVAEQAAIAAIGQRGLAGEDENRLMDEVVKSVVDTVEGGRAALFERGEDGALTLRAAAGWPDDVEPSASRARCIEIPLRTGAWGVLTVQAGGARPCSAAETTFLRSMAHVLAAAIERARGEELIRHQALHDALTGLPNRALLMSLLDHALERERRTASTVAVLVIDLDNFKLINDTLGHAAGDELLAALAARLRAVMRQCDTVARYGGDEFVVVGEDMASEFEAARLAERVLGVFTQPFQVAGAERSVTASVGVVVAREDRWEPDALLRDADAAMRRAKEQGGDRHQIFDAGMRERARRRLYLIGELREAIARDQLALHYQPIFSQPDGRIAGAEALLRWHSDAFPEIAPAQFIPAAEEGGLIVAIGTWVLERACRDAAGWPDEMMVTVNVSARQLALPSFASLVADALETHGLAPERLALELTETILLEDDIDAGGTIAALRKLGVRLVLDDFGSGFSSLRYLLQFPIHALKIDRSFVAELPHGRRARAIVAAVTTMAAELDKAIVAEGIENEAQLAAVREFGCEFAQGYLLGRAGPVEQLAAFW